MKKKLLVMVLACVCVLFGASSLAAKLPKADMGAEGKKLVVYFSHTGENRNVGVIEKGNTHIIADIIADEIGADRFEIVPAVPYPKNYDECLSVAKKELHTDARPAVKGDVKIENYDVIFIGYPNWWGEVPMCVYTFINKHDWTGKIVIPFVTHEGSGMGSIDRRIATACPGATVATGRGLAIQGKVAQTNQASAKQSVRRWLDGLGF